MAKKKGLTKILKRDGRLSPFNPNKIYQAIYKAISSEGQKDPQLAKRITTQVVKAAEQQFENKTIPSVEDIQDLVEKTLIENKLAEVARAYILYRKNRTEVREVKHLIGVSDDLKLAVNAAKVLERRYLLKDSEGRVIETPVQMFRRVAKAVASADSPYNKKAKVEKTEEEFYQVMTSLDFLPNSPTLMNAGTPVGQLSACFVLPVEDSIKSIFNAMKYMALIHKSGGGTGFSFSRLRPKGDVVKTTKGIASGPLSFIQAFDAATDVIKQGGRRRGANMGILRVNHPDILEFITAKEKEGQLTNFNISVAVTDEFMEAVVKNKTYELINPRTNQAVKSLPARDVFNLIATMAWRTGDPGLVFLDEINRINPTPNLGEIESTNPCGEQPLLPYESCNLGSINLVKMIKGKTVDWQKLSEVVRISVHFLDNVIDVNQFPLPQIKKITLANRKIGLGVMGFAEMLIRLGIPYDSEKALRLAGRLTKFITSEARKKSIELAKERGSFPNFKQSIWREQGFKALRNATLTTIAPTGTISIIANVTSGIEPLFAISFVRNVMEGSKLLETNPSFIEIAKKRGFYNRGLLMKIATKGPLKDIKEIPSDIRRLFVTALDINPQWHIRMQAAFQKHVDNAVAKTVNLAPEATLEDVKNTFLLAHRLCCKGVTVYRYGSKKEQVLYLGSLLDQDQYVSAESEYAGGCPAVQCPF